MISFLKFIVCMTAGIAALAVIGLLLSLGRTESVVIYQMVLAVNALVLVGGFFGIRGLEKKERRLAELLKG